MMQHYTEICVRCESPRLNLSTLAAHSIFVPVTGGPLRPNLHSLR